MEFLLDRRTTSRANLAKRLFIASVCAMFVFTSAAQLLPIYEVEVLRTISSTLHNNHWNISRSSCTDSNGFNITIVPVNIESNVTCDCSFINNTVCHVTNIKLKGLNMTGTLPVEFANLTYLREIDLTRNYLNGTIPRMFGQLRVVNISLLGNRLTGRIPDEIGDITTLEFLNLEDNLFEGNLPVSLGRLRNLMRLQLSSNNFNGTIPETYSNLRNLTEFRIDGSAISGRIPEFIGNWTLLLRLHARHLDDGTYTYYNIPVEKLDRIRRISDLRGPSTSFPDLRSAAMMRLVLRNCSITGGIPPYLGGVENMGDLSFNRLNGEIPVELQGLDRLDFLFLSQNSLTGGVPNWIQDRREDSM
ncbi:hypothetical protein CASFOL_022650 [Castilleja foliolosa]|uniref:Uncharacterized protein n=1 Tax=Castilleja foliolosa TaxID=1961234 RepID=A0ABD3CW29_9LAMI